MKGTKISKRVQNRNDLINRKLYESNRGCSDWKFQLHWNMLEWVDPKSTPKIVKPFQFLQKSSILIIMIEHLILLVILNLNNWILLGFIKENRKMKI